MTYATNFDPKKILNPVWDAPFQGLLLGKVWSTPRSYGWKKLPSPKKFNGSRPLNVGPNFCNYTYIRPSEL